MNLLLNKPNSTSRSFHTCSSINYNLHNWNLHNWLDTDTYLWFIFLSHILYITLISHLFLQHLHDPTIASATEFSFCKRHRGYQTIHFKYCSLFLVRPTIAHQSCAPEGYSHQFRELTDFGNRQTVIEVPNHSFYILFLIRPTSTFLSLTIFHRYGLSWTLNYTKIYQPIVHTLCSSIYFTLILSMVTSVSTAN